MSKLPWEGFIAGSDQGAPTRAKPEVWKEPAKFKELQEKLMIETAKLETVAKTGDEAAFKGTGRRHWQGLRQLPRRFPRQVTSAIDLAPLLAVAHEPPYRRSARREPDRGFGAVALPPPAIAGAAWSVLVPSSIGLMRFSFSPKRWNSTAPI